jgi:hypothetical protein
MGDHGGRFGGGLRDGGGGGGGRIPPLGHFNHQPPRNNVWQRDQPEGSKSAGSRSERWDAAVKEVQGGGKDKQVCVGGPIAECFLCHQSFDSLSQLQCQWSFYCSLPLDSL